MEGNSVGIMPAVNHPILRLTSLATAKYCSGSHVQKTHCFLYKLLAKVFGCEFSSVPMLTRRTVYFMKLVLFRSWLPSAKGVFQVALETQSLLKPFTV